jgi:hypothetical protein
MIDLVQYLVVGLVLLGIGTLVMVIVLVFMDRDDREHEGRKP